MRAYADDFARIARYLGDHEATGRQSRAFDFRRPGTFAYAYSLAWTAGSISLAGDCGEVTLVHYHALATLKDGLHWAAYSDYDYLLGKTNLRQSYDPEGTFKWLRDHLNDEAIRARQSERKELQRWRRDKPTPESFPDPKDLAEELAWWSGDGRPETFKVEPRSPYASRSRWSSVGEYEAPDGWLHWLRGWAATRASADPNDIFTPKGRAAILYEIERRCEHREDVYILKDDLGLDDWYGSERWTFSDLLKIECIRKGAREALGVLRHEEFEAAPYEWRSTTFRGLTPVAPRSVFVDWIAAAFVDQAGWRWTDPGLFPAAEAALAEMLDASGGGYNSGIHWVSTPLRYGAKDFDWTPAGALEIALEEMSNWDAEEAA